MTAYILIRYLHFIAIFGVVSALVTEHLLLSKTVSRQQIKRISIIDLIYGISAIVVLVAGLLMWFWVGKHADFYTKNWIFHTKLTLFVVLGLISIVPSRFFLKNRKGADLNEEIEVPKMIIMILRFELLLILIIPLLGAIMSMGVGSFS